MSQMSEKLSSKRLETTNAGEDVEKKEHFAHCWWEHKLV